MLQTITDKFAESAVPILTGLGIWYGAHYAVLTPRIMKVDLPSAYGQESQSIPIPRLALNCVSNNIVERTLEHSRLQAALYTASFRHISAPFHEKQAVVEERLNDECGVNLAIAAEEARLAQERELERMRAAQRLREEAAERARAVQERIEQEARDRAIKGGLTILGLIMGAAND